MALENQLSLRKVEKPVCAITVYIPSKNESSLRQAHG